MLNREPEVLVAGAGPVGLFAALKLNRLGVQAEIADRVWRAGTHSYALALHPQSLGLLQEVGILDAVMAEAYPVRKIGLYDRDGERGSIAIDGFPGSWSCLAVLRQDVLEQLLEKALAQAGVPVRWSHEVFMLDGSADRVSARIDKFEKDSVGYSVARTEWVLAKTYNIEVPFVLGADGHRSRVRRALKIDYPEVRPAEHYAVFEFETDAKLGDEVRLCFGGGTTDVLWPLPGNYCRWSFQLPDYKEPAARDKDRLFSQPSAAEFPVLTEDNLRALLAERAPWFAGNIGAITWRNVVRFEMRMAGAFGLGRMVLAGDSAHLTGPAGVQSMNLGLAEASDYAMAIAEVLHEGKPASTLNDRTEAWRQEWKRVLAVGSTLKGGAGTDPWISEISARLLSCLPAHGEELDRLAAQLKLAFAATAAA